MDWKNMWENSRSTIISGIIAIVVIAGLFFLFNSVPTNQSDNNSDDQDKEQQEQNKPEGEEEKNDGSKDVTGKISLPTTYTVASGDSLWTISEKFYGTGYSWVVVAQENKLADPDAIHTGNVLTIPKSLPATGITSAESKSYTVVAGDSLWSISQKYYGSGFDWTKIRDANPGKIGTLSNGRPLITPGQVLNIP